MKVTGKDLLDTLEGSWFGDIGTLETPVAICLDTRKLVPGQVFVGITGEKFDGNMFAEEALQKGAAGVIVTRSPPEGYPTSGHFWVKVEDEIRGLWQITSALRQRFTGFVIAVTGTVGKTGTKECVAHALRKAKRVAQARLSENNEIGVPKAFLEAPEDTEVLVLEFGMRKFGDIRKLAEVARPHLGVITGITPVHLETMEEMRAIAYGKAELLAWLEPPEISVINADTEYFDILKSSAPRVVMTFGKKGEYSFQVVRMDERGRCEFRLTTPTWRGEFKSPLSGEIQGYGITAALAVAEAMGVSIDFALSGLEEMAPLPHRLQVYALSGGGALIDDCYNASPASMNEAIHFTKRMAGTRRKVAILGEMLELGAYSDRYHEELGARVAEAGFDLLVGVGAAMKHTVKTAAEHGMRCLWFASAHQVCEHLEDFGNRETVVLIKGSRAVQLESVVEEYLRWTGAR
ncbi:MAG: UDP-N-acetylmuramoyl-tripeptide--D-alanyl-D-alanine ligase [bacterium JZ-2024 1]